jgi:transposase-like protein
MAKKGQKFKVWSAEEKYKIIRPIIDLEISLTQVGKETGISSSMLHSWTKLYKENGIDGLKSKKKPGNPLSKFQNKKNLTKEEQLEYENMKLRIENELLKKGYLMKGDGTIVKFTK